MRRWHLDDGGPRLLHVTGENHSASESSHLKGFFFTDGLTVFDCGGRLGAGCSSCAAHGAGALASLGARPRSPRGAARLQPDVSPDEFNVLNLPAAQDGSWATTNLTEALPGVPTPLGWSIWARASDRAARIPFYAMGAIDEEDLRFPERSEDRVVNLLFGHIAIRVDYFCEMGDLVPGANGEAVARDAFGFVPPNYVSRRSRRRWPMFLVRMPVTFLRTPGQVRDLLEETTSWYEREIARTAQLDLAGARTYEEGSRRFLESMSQTAVSIACVIQPVFTALSKLADDTGWTPRP